MTGAAGAVGTLVTARKWFVLLVALLGSIGMVWAGWSYGREALRLYRTPQWIFETAEGGVGTLRQLGSRLWGQGYRAELVEELFGTKARASLVELTSTVVDASGAVLFSCSLDDLPPEGPPTDGDDGSPRALAADLQDPGVAWAYADATVRAWRKAAR